MRDHEEKEAFAKIRELEERIEAQKHDARAKAEKMVTNANAQKDELIKRKKEEFAEVSRLLDESGPNKSPPCSSYNHELDEALVEELARDLFDKIIIKLEE